MAKPMLDTGPRKHRSWAPSRRQWAVSAASHFGFLFGRRLSRAIGIFTYHRIAEPTPGVEPPTWNVSPAQFQAQLTSLLSQGYEAWPLRKVLEFHRLGKTLPRTVFVVTFDDGYENVHRFAWPVLRELNIPATVFLATAYLDSEEVFPFDDWAAASRDRVPSESWRPLSTGQCREMLAGGQIELGTHTHTHPNVRGRPEVLRQELVQSQDVLREQFGLTEATFAFPFGIAGPDLSEAAAKSGVLCALTTQEDLVTPDSNPYAWGRFGVHEHDTGKTLAGKLAGWYSLARSAWLRLPFRTRSSVNVP